MSRRPVPPDAPEKEGARPSGLRRAGRVLGVVGGSAALFGVLAVAVFPTSTFLEQRADTAEVEERLAVLRAQNEAYEERIERLQTASEIVRLAREQYNLVFPGEEAYAVLPAPLPELDLPAVWPFGELLEPDPAE
jgi:cell division protein FtsB